MKQGFKIVDSDIHMTEPQDLWERYLDPDYLEWVNFEWNNVGASFRRINKDRLEPTIAALYPIRAELNRLRVAFLEGNCTWLIWWLWRLDEEWEKFGECDEPVVQLEMKPSAYFRRQGFISIDPDETVGHYVVEEGFEDNLVLSTDWPHDDSAYPHALDKFLALERIPEEAKRKILWDNCAHLYKFA